MSAVLIGACGGPPRELFGQIVWYEACEDEEATARDFWLYPVEPEPDPELRAMCERRIRGSEVTWAYLACEAHACVSARARSARLRDQPEERIACHHEDVEHSAELLHVALTASEHHDAARAAFRVLTIGQRARCGREFFYREAFHFVPP